MINTENISTKTQGKQLTAEEMHENRMLAVKEE